MISEDHQQFLILSGSSPDSWSMPSEILIMRFLFKLLIQQFSDKISNPTLGSRKDGLGDNSRH